MPSWTSLPYHPIRFFSDAMQVYVMHVDYKTEQVEFQRARNVLDTQKRRIYRRAHGMEDLDRDEDQGVDVRGIVPWDDGLTKKERAAGGIGANRIKMASTVNVGVGMDEEAFYQAAAERVSKPPSIADMEKEMFIRRRQEELGLSMEDDPAIEALNKRRTEASQLGPWTPTRRMDNAINGDSEPETDVKPQEVQAQAPQEPPQPEKKRKLYFGIW